MKKICLIAALLTLIAGPAPPGLAGDLAAGFRRPPDEAKPWVFWFWINGNISKEGITKDLEAMKRVGIHGVLWMEVAGKYSAPKGPIEGGTSQWHDAMQWAISEADRLGMDFTLSVDFGYGSGGPHITPDLSMQELLWTETAVQGGQAVTLTLKKPIVGTEPKRPQMRADDLLNPKVTRALNQIDSYRDVAVFAVPSSNPKASAIPHLEKYDGRGWQTHLPSLADNRELAPLARQKVIDLTDRMTDDGRLQWNAPKGNWTVVRLGHATNLKLTRPCPVSMVGLECDRLHRRGIETHFEHHLKPILAAAGEKAGRTLKYIHIDSWEAHGQNWTTDFAAEFRKRRGYDPGPWLPVLTGQVVESVEMTDRFLWDMRKTVSAVTLSNYIDRLRELIAPFGVEFSSEPYGRLCVDQLAYGGRSNFPICEFWTERAKLPFHAKNPPKLFPTFSGYWYTSMKGLASVANTYGQTRVGAEAFTGSRGWGDHPYLIKGMGDEAFSEGVSHYIYHLSAHQAYDQMKPGLTHRRWGQHYNRHQTWWEFTKPYFDYVARCQFLLQQGRRVVDVACLYHEGAPLDFNDIRFEMPSGYDHDFCNPQIIQRMEVKDGRIHLPTGVSYRYLVLPRAGRLTLPTAQKVEQLRKAGASVYLQSRIVGTPGLKDYPQADTQVRAIASKWPVLPEGGLTTLFASHYLKPDFQAEGLRWIHRRTEGTDLYFVANIQPKPTKQQCIFRTTGKTTELWNPETGEIFPLTAKAMGDGGTSVVLPFEPAQSWFVVFRDKPSEQPFGRDPFVVSKPLQQIKGSWRVSFDPDWGPKDATTFETLQSWSMHTDPLIKYYSGTGTYRTTFDFSKSDVLNKDAALCLDLGGVEVVARVTLNGKDCGIAWKPPYRVDITKALQAGENQLEIEVVNTWVNRMIGDEQLPLDAKWQDWETLIAWPDWFQKKTQRPTGRYTFTSARHYDKNTPLMPSGLLGPVVIHQYGKN